MKKDEIIVIEATPYRRHGEKYFSGLKFSCPYCHHDHHHSLSEGLRTPHCDDENFPHGYSLKLPPGYRWVIISICPPETTEEIWESEDDARKAKEIIDASGCGGKCIGKMGHIVTVKKIK